MKLTAFSIQGYRSVRKVTLPVEACSVFVGTNGVGKTNLYKGLGLLRRAADGSITRAIAEDGGVESALWAGSRQVGKPVRLIFKASLDTLTYSIEVGLPSPSEAAFTIEPLVKEERIVVRQGRRESVMMERKGPFVMLRNDEGVRESHEWAVLPSETALAAFRDGSRYPELEIVRRELLDWRLYHDFRTDDASPIRQPCHAITTPTLSADGHDLAAVLATLSLVGGNRDLRAAVDDAFPGAVLNAWDDGSWCRFSLQFPDMPRPFGAHELSDGTLKYLCLLGALMSYRLPSLIALNEPEASMHPSLLPPLARLIGRGSHRARLWVVTHSDVLAQALEAENGHPARRVVKVDGATQIENLTVAGEYREDEEDDEGESEEATRRGERLG